VGVDWTVPAPAKPARAKLALLVIADDLAGAAEMGGIALRHGLSAEVWRSPYGVWRALGSDAIVVDTDTRSCTAAEAAQRVGQALEGWAAAGGALPLVFKKVDSVLRGQVAAELGALLERCRRRRALLVPANPGLGRTIVEGRYLVGGIPLDETDFARDPEYPARTAMVRDLLGPAGPWPVRVVRLSEPLPERGIAVGEAACQADLDAWAARLAAERASTDTLPAGASEFLSAYLRALGHHPLPRAPVETPAGCAQSGRAPLGRTLYVCGSTSAPMRAFCARCEAHGVPVLRIPPPLLDEGAAANGRARAGRARVGARALVEAWAAEAVGALEQHGRVVMAIDRPLRRQPGLPQALGAYLSAAVAQVLARAPVAHLLVTGGATAMALMRQMGWTRLAVRRELATGVVTVQIMDRPEAAHPLVTLKPGSYAWPDEVAV
jgi:uncharacterized protein YgbK (DUF1537 family)